ncbi:MAG: PHP domain-containing protein [Tepidanaerobacteraceae bacterium]|nr:PHP domain-containing protein [Tepidanaerobacteraceae bacterium]
MKIDLHIHTTFSDGRLTPVEVVQTSRILGLKAIAITDHDTVDGIQLAVDEAEKYKDIEVVPGIEINTYYKEQDVHILGYYIDYKSTELRNILSNILQKRLARVLKIAEKLKQLGIDIGFDEINKKAAGPSLGRPHIAQVLIEKGYAASMEEAFVKFLNPDRPAFVPRYKLTPFNAVDIIKKSKGIPVLAHPGLLYEMQIIKDLVDYGIMGIEVYHKNHTPSQVDFLIDFATRKNLLMTGGSDSHGEYPLLLGTLDVPWGFLQRLKYKKSEGCL